MPIYIFLCIKRVSIVCDFQDHVRQVSVVCDPFINYHQIILSARPSAEQPDDGEGQCGEGGWTERREEDGSQAKAEQERP